MFSSLPRVLEQIHRDLTNFLQADVVIEVFRQAGMRWRTRVLDPLTTLRLFVLQILHGNTAINHLRHFHSDPFTDSAYCQARGRLPLAGLRQLLQRLVSALQPLMKSDGRWLGHRTFHIDGSGFSMSDTRRVAKSLWAARRSEGGLRLSGGPYADPLSCRLRLPSECVGGAVADSRSGLTPPRCMTNLKQAMCWSATGRFVRLRIWPCFLCENCTASSAFTNGNWSTSGLSGRTTGRAQNAAKACPRRVG